MRVCDGTSKDFLRPDSSVSILNRMSYVLGGNEQIRMGVVDKYLSNFSEFSCSGMF